MVVTEGARIFVPLARGPFEKFKARTKTVEIRQEGSPVARQVVKAEEGATVCLSLGYGKKDRLHAILGERFRSGSGIDGLPLGWVLRAHLDNSTEPKYFARDEPIVAFEVLGVVPWQ